MRYKLLLGIVMFAMLSICASAVEHCYEIDLRYYKGDIELRSLDVKIAEGTLESFGQYSAVVKSADGSTLNITLIDIPNLVLFDNFDSETGEITGGGLVYLDEVNHTFEIPYYPDAQKIDIYDQNLTLKLEIDVSQYSLKAAEELMEEAPSAEAGEIIPHAAPKEIFGQRWLFFLISALVLLIVFFLLMKKGKRKKVRRR